MSSTSNKIRVYTNGLVQKNVGAYAYIVLENENCGEVDFGEGKGRMFAPSSLKCKFAQAGPATDEMRMKMRAVYEGVRHCPDGAEVEVYTDNFLIDTTLNKTTPAEADYDIAIRYRQYVAQHGVKPQFILCKHYYENDLPANDHDEWAWLAYHMCEKAIKEYGID